MESEPFGSATALDAVRAVRERAAAMSRPYAWLLLWGAAQLSLYIGVWLFTVSGGLSSTTTWSTTSLLLPTILLYSPLVVGARERFASRPRYRGAYAWVALFAVLILLGLGGVAILGGGFPWWVAVIAGVVAFAALGAQPVRLLLRPALTTPGSDPWRSEPLDTVPKVLTIATGAYFGIAVALASMPIVVSLLTIAAMFLFIIAASAPYARWSIAQAGFAWGRVHWTSLGISVVLVYGVVVVVALVGVLPPLAAIGCGILVAAPLVVAAFLPRPR